jgi:uncharacterized Zn finger protein (UPF0148 family)
MQARTRCPRCGYVLSYDGHAYYCTFCGYPRTPETLGDAFHSLERRVSGEVRRLLDGLKPKTTAQTFYYPVSVTMQPCANCGHPFPRGLQRCPSCGTDRPLPGQATVTSTPAEATDLDRRVFDYINAHGGTISISQTAHDLAIGQELLLSSIERLKSAGYLTQP